MIIKKKKVNLLQDKLEQTIKKQIVLQNGLEQIEKNAKSFTKLIWTDHKNAKWEELKTTKICQRKGC